MSNINYMTDDQKADMAYFQKMMTENGDYQKVYTVTTDSTMMVRWTRVSAYSQCWTD